MRSTLFMLAIVLLAGCGGSDEDATKDAAAGGAGEERPEATGQPLDRRTEIEETPEPVDPMIELARRVTSGDSSVRAEAAARLGDMSGPNRAKAAELLVPLLADDDEDVRQVAAQAYGNLEGADLDPLRERVKNEEVPEVKKAVLAAAFDLAGEDAIQLLLSVAADDFEEEFVRAFAIDALGRLKAASARKYLEEACEDISEVIRRKAVIALGEIGAEASIDKIGERVRDNSPLVRIEAVRALGKIGKRRIVRFLIRGFDVENDPELFHEINAVLEEVTDAKQGYDRAKSIEENRAAIDGWLSWWQENKSYY